MNNLDQWKQKMQAKIDEAKKKYPENWWECFECPSASTKYSWRVCRNERNVYAALEDFCLGERKQ